MITLAAPAVNSYSPERLAAWLKAVNEKGQQYWQREAAVLAERSTWNVRAEEGKRYIRIVKFEKQKATGAETSVSSFAFIDKTTGDILKCAGWKAPAKGARGNLGDPTGGLGQVGPYGPAYLRGPDMGSFSEYEAHWAKEDAKKTDAPADLAIPYV
jgi:hypothetical protein